MDPPRLRGPWLDCRGIEGRSWPGAEKEGERLPSTLSRRAVVRRVRLPSLEDCAEREIQIGLPRVGESENPPATVAGNLEKDLHGLVRVHLA